MGGCYRACVCVCVCERGGCLCVCFGGGIARWGSLKVRGGLGMQGIYICVNRLWLHEGVCTCVDLCVVCLACLCVCARVHVRVRVYLCMCVYLCACGHMARVRVGGTEDPSTEPCRGRGDTFGCYCCQALVLPPWGYISLIFPAGIRPGLPCWWAFWV